ncbi:MAG: AAA family ATPase [Steroidobacteraceae bacterium]|nr:AAA family ATPase [Steroidobacteraceae bacterium]MDW8260502.1 AAA family ATPase [Gammaproteobacteria bacterium]
MLPAELQGLLDPRAYPHAVGSVRVVETHISWLLLTGDYAYKIKRPVVFPFLDFRALERREFFCREELRLNRRFAPELYLAVVQIVRSNGRLRIDAAGEPIEYAVRMRQFAAADELGALLADERVTVGELERFGDDLARIHAELPVLPSLAEPERTRRMLLDNAAQCALAAVDDRVRAAVEDCRSQLAARIEAQAELLDQRDRGGRIRDCHGDLHVSNVARVGGRLRAFDCLEFEPEFRRIDVAHEIAFLAMDLTAHGRGDLAGAFLNGWLVNSGDYQSVELLDLYEAHCALVRAKVAGLNVTRVAPAESNALAARQRNFVALASERLAPHRPRLLLMHGVSGSGKSWLAARLAYALDGIWLRSDVERKRLAGLLPLARTGSRPDRDLYSVEHNAATYASLLEKVQHVLRGGRTAIVDATFLTAASRMPFMRLARERRVPIVVLACQAPVEELERRVQARGAQGTDPSEATVDVLHRQLARVEPPDPVEGAAVLPVDTCKPDIVATLLPSLCVAG